MESKLWCRSQGIRTICILGRTYELRIHASAFKLLLTLIENIFLSYDYKMVHTSIGKNGYTTLICGELKSDWCKLTFHFIVIL